MKGVWRQRQALRELSSASAGPRALAAGWEHRELCGRDGELQDPVGQNYLQILLQANTAVSKPSLSNASSPAVADS